MEVKVNIKLVFVFNHTYEKPFGNHLMRTEVKEHLPCLDKQRHVCLGYYTAMDFVLLYYGSTGYFKCDRYSLKPERDGEVYVAG